MIFKKVKLLSERCDKCPAKGIARVKHERDQTDLVFCSHHFQLYAPILTEQGFRLVEGNGQ